VVSGNATFWLSRVGNVLYINARVAVAEPSTIALASFVPFVGLFARRGRSKRVRSPLA
jgi:hypothetical protein